MNKTKISRRSFLAAAGAAGASIALTARRLCFRHCIFRSRFCRCFFRSCR